MEKGNNRIKRIDSKIKKEVMEMLKEPGYSIVEISKAYGISTSSLHKWKASLSNKDETRKPEFVELTVVDNKCCIKKASILFDNLSVSFEGKINSSNLISIIKILEAS